MYRSIVSYKCNSRSTLHPKMEVYSPIIYYNSHF